MRTLFCLILGTVLGGVVGISSLDSLDDHMEASVLVSAAGSCGSGVIFVNHEYNFAWTDFHVVEDCQSVAEVDGQPKVSYKDVWLSQPVVKGGTKVGETKMHAKIIACGKRDDLALLVLTNPAFTKGVTFADGPPRVGTSVWHVGSMHGNMGINSVSLGVVAGVGRLRLRFKDNEKEGIIYDQASMVAHHGSSGGGIFDKRTGKCLGLVTEFLWASRDDESHGSLCFTPARRLREFARRNKVEFAVDASIKVDVSIFANPITDGDIPALPKKAEPIPMPRAYDKELDELLFDYFTLD